jgi:hypothetical protein
MEPSIELSKQAAFTTQASALVPDSPSSPPSILKPFQFIVLEAGTKNAEATISIASTTAIQNVCNDWRHAKLHNLEVTLFPQGSSVAPPTTIDILWTTANSPTVPPGILQVYGGKSFAIGGAISTLKPIIIPCPLNMVQPIVKDSVLYLDTPRLLISVSAAATPPTTATCRIVVSGQVRIHSPLLTDTTL